MEDLLIALSFVLFFVLFGKKIFTIITGFLDNYINQAKNKFESCNLALIDVEKKLSSIKDIQKEQNKRVVEMHNSVKIEIANVEENYAKMAENIKQSSEITIKNSNIFIEQKIKEDAISAILKRTVEEILMTKRQDFDYKITKEDLNKISTMYK